MGIFVYGWICLDLVGSGLVGGGFGGISRDRMGLMLWVFEVCVFIGFGGGIMMLGEIYLVVFGMVVDLL